MRYAEEDDDPVISQEVPYQLILLHDKHGAGYEGPVYDLGWFKANDAILLAAYIGKCAQECGYDFNDGEVISLLDAWASLHYRVWFLPASPALPCWEYRDNQVVLSKEDPR